MDEEKFNIFTQEYRSYRPYFERELLEPSHMDTNPLTVIDRARQDYLNRRITDNVNPLSEPIFQDEHAVRPNLPLYPPGPRIRAKDYLTSREEYIFHDWRLFSLSYPPHYVKPKHRALDEAASNGQQYVNGDISHDDFRAKMRLHKIRFFDASLHGYVDQYFNDVVQSNDVHSSFSRFLNNLRNHFSQM